MAIDRTPGQRTDANTRYFDAAIRHQVGVRNLTTQQVNELIGLLETMDQDLTGKIRQRLKKFVGIPFNPRTKKFQDLLIELRGIRSVALRELEQKFRTNLIDLGKLEVDFEKRMMEGALPVVLDLESPSTQTLTSLIATRPFGEGSVGGRNLRQWFQSLKQSDQQRITGAIQAGLFQGEGIDEIVRRVVGRRSNGFRDGVLGLTRRQAEAVIRTAVNGISNTAREAVWAANTDILQGLMWTAVLDGRTTAICQSRDGKVAPIGDTALPSGTPRLEPPGARPPAHVACRSIMTAVFSSEGVMAAAGVRPFVRSTKNARGRRLDFRKQAREQAGAEWTTLSRAERNTRVASLRENWGQRNIGTIPATVNYQEWLQRQPSSFQDSVLGKTKGELFRTEKVGVDDFVTRRGNALTLEQLAQTDPTAFISAGLSPDNFL